MKIGIITDSINSNLTGIGYFAQGFIDALLKRDTINNYFFINFIEKKLNDKNFIVIKNKNFIFKTYSWHNQLPLLTRRQKIDIILNLTGIPHAFKYKQKEFFFVYDISWYLFPKYHKIGRVMFYKLLFKTTLKNSFKIVVISENTKKDLIKYFQIDTKKIIVLYPFLPPVINNEKKPNIMLPKNYILYIGTIEPRKNINTIIKALDMLKKNKKLTIPLVIAGKKGWLFNNTFELIKQLDMDKDVFLTGYISDKEKSYLYKHADLFVYPSLYEGFGIPPIEALSYGCPTITSNLSSLPEAVGDAAIMIDPTNINDLANAIYELKTNVFLKNKMIKKGYLQANKFTNLNQMKKLIDVYKSKNIKT